MIVWAVDPGLRGALVVIEHNLVTHVIRMPLMPHPTSKYIKHKIDVQRLNDMVRLLPLPDKSIIELPEVINTNARLTIASLFQSVGIVDGVISAYCDDIRFVTPRRWKAKYNLISKTKWDSIQAAKMIFPDLKVELVKDADISEAALIGHWLLKYSGAFL